MKYRLYLIGEDHEIKDSLEFDSLKDVMKFISMHIEKSLCFTCYQINIIYDEIDD